MTEKRTVLCFETGLIHSAKKVLNTLLSYGVFLSETSVQVYNLIHFSSPTHSVHSCVGSFNFSNDICQSRSQLRNLMISAEEIIQLVRNGV